MLEEFSVMDGSVYIPISVPYKLSEHTDVMIIGKGDSPTANAQCSALFEGWIEDNS